MQINKQTKCSGWNQLFIDVIGSGFTQDSFQGGGKGGGHWSCLISNHTRSYKYKSYRGRIESDVFPPESWVHKSEMLKEIFCCSPFISASICG